MYGYLAKSKHAAIHTNTWEPDYSGLHTNAYVPSSRGKFVILTHYIDANLMYYILTGRYITGIIHLLNGTPIDLF